jgi:hypothetical protein
LYVVVHLRSVDRFRSLARTALLQKITLTGSRLVMDYLDYVQTWLWLWGIASTSTVVVVIWAVVTLDYAHLPAFPESGHYENPFTIDCHRDVY